MSRSPDRASHIFEAKDGCACERAAVVQPGGGNGGGGLRRTQTYCQHGRTELGHPCLFAGAGLSVVSAIPPPAPASAAGAALVLF